MWVTGYGHHNEKYSHPIHTKATPTPPGMRALFFQCLFSGDEILSPCLLWFSKSYWMMNHDEVPFRKGRFSIILRALTAREQSSFTVVWRNCQETFPNKQLFNQNVIVPFLQTSWAVVPTPYQCLTTQWVQFGEGRVKWNGVFKHILVNRWD